MIVSLSIRQYLCRYAHTYDGVRQIGAYNIGIRLRIQ